MKKRYIILAGLLAVTVFAAGCGKEEETAPENVQVTATPAPESSAGSELVDMQQSADEDTIIKNVLGTKTASSSKFILVNKTGDDVASVYIRPHTEDDDDDTWGEDLIDGRFILKDGDKAVYYYEKGEKDDSGNPVTSYDIRIAYTDTERYECFFRKLPFSAITQLTLRMDGEGESALPFATYLSEGNKKEVSTLEDVKRRVGMLDSEDSEEDQDDDSEDDYTEAQPTPTPDGGEEPAPPEDDDSGDDTQDGEDPVSVAEGFIGQSLDALEGVCGQPTGSDYQDEPETGKTGYHYYTIGNTTFTVSTTVDENGNEIVAGVW